MLERRSFWWLPKRRVSHCSSFHVFVNSRAWSLKQLCLCLRRLFNLATFYFMLLFCPVITFLVVLPTEWHQLSTTPNTSAPGGLEEARKTPTAQKSSRGSHRAFVTANQPKWTPRLPQAPTSRGGILIIYYIFKPNDVESTSRGHVMRHLTELRWHD